MAADDLEQLLNEQVAYYSARAPEYLETTLADVFEAETLLADRQVSDELDALAPLGDVLEIACGPGTFTASLARRAERVTALDSSPEMLAIARGRIANPRVSFEQADVFAWLPQRRYDFVFFGFWISHVPLERFAAFWATVARALRPGGHVGFIDDAYRTPEELIEGPQSATIRRRLNDGRAFRVVKVAHEPAALERRIVQLGWRVTVKPLAGPFYWGSGSR